MIRTFRLCSSSARQGRWRSLPGSGGSRPVLPFLPRPWSSNRAIRPRFPHRATHEKSLCGFQSRRWYRCAPRRAAHSQQCPAPENSWRPSLLVLLDNSLEIVPHLRNRLAHHLHFAAGTAFDDNVEFRVARILFGEVVTEVAAAAFLALECSAGDDLRYRQQVLQIKGGVPPRIVLPVSSNRHLPRALTQRFESFQCATDLFLAAHDADQLLHHSLQIVLDLVGALFAALPIERLQCGSHDLVSLLGVCSRCCLPSRVFGGVFARAHSEYQQIRQ